MSTSRASAPEVRHDTWASPAHRRTVYLVLAVVGLAILFDGYDLVIYGAVLSTLLEDPSHIGQLSPAVAGSLGSYAMIGVLIGALSSGAVGDRLGRRKVFLAALVWFSLGMIATALATTIFWFGFLRFITGLGVGVIVAMGGAIIAEFAPANRKNLFNAVVYSGVPGGGVMASILALLLEEHIGWRGLFMIGGAPLIIVFPLALAALPESPRWLVSRGRIDQARAVCAKYGLPAESFVDAPAQAIAASTETTSASGARRDVDKTGFSGIFSRSFLPGTVLIGLMSFIGLLSTYGLNTWLPKIMQANGATQHDSLYSLLALNGGAVVGGLFASWVADKIGAKLVITSTFTLAGIMLALLPQFNSVAVMYVPIMLAGLGVLGTQVLTYGLTSNYYSTASRAAGVAWCAGFGRLGGIVGPLVGGLILGANLGPAYAFYIFAGAAILGAICTALIPRSPAEVEVIATTEPEAPKVATA
ncbi:MFS transporter [Corynebacterium cystitidis]|uniref:MFS transporter, AAHS family, benzoate transport protein n=1 Tax=Corynebacterium cystitidis DSM 20524 TaxID=1121357 RepID=A0A1H9SSQ0_9CORY|nr:aromatic acid/H+ symport family MFS transporter [Corynebacterium cystitidis]WJY83144.1 4-hydroxybenzoate transporter PcaK [Corynebacterium cystitidis DSM 20524]SER87359.1 MFS transporter, AAHS family, benzoate transport protein [Corynebacterium cystitidis DSM 20524]SNV66736.1 putative benzoate transporter [Corynebacterium cystitidis]